MNRKSISKFIIATAIFYLVLMCNVFHLGEKLLPQEADKNYLNDTTPVENMDIEAEYFNTISTNETS